MDEGKYFKIRSGLSGMLVDVEGGSTSPGARVIMWPDTGAPNQLWYEDHITGTVRSKLNDYCLEMTGSGAVVNPYHPDEYNQQWTVAEDRIHHRENPASVMDISGSSSDEGADLVAWDFHGGPNQIFVIEYQEAFCFYIRSKMHGKVMDVEGARTDPGTKVVMYDQHESPQDNQLFYEDKYGSIHTKLNDFALDFDDEKIRINPYDPMKASQQWVISGDTIRNKLDPNQVIDIIDEDSWNGAYLCSYDYSGNSNQLWTFDYI